MNGGAGRRRAARGAVSLVLILGCQGGEPGNQGGRAPDPAGVVPPAPPVITRPPGVPPSTQTPPSCPVRSTMPLGLDETAPLGFAPRDLLRFAGGELAVPLEWQPGYAGSAALRMNVEPTGTPRFMLRGPSPCQDSVEIDVRVKLTTADGALAENFTSILFAYTSDIARFDHVFTPEAVARIYGKQRAAVPGGLEATAVFTRYGAAGSLYATSGDPVALWPHTSVCLTGVPIVDTTTVRPSVDDLIQSFRGNGWLARVDRTLVPVTMTPRPVDRSACYRANSIIEANDGLEVAVNLELRPRTGPALTLAVRLFGDLEDGKMFGGVTGGFGPCSENNVLDVAQFLEQCGDWGVDLRGFHGAHLSARANDVDIIGDGGTNCRRSPALDNRFECDTFEFVYLGHAAFGFGEP